MLGDLCDRLVPDWEVEVVAANRSRQTVRERCNNVAVPRVGAWGTVHSVPLCPSLPLHLWRGRADCVVLHEPNPIAGTALFVRTPARRLVIWHHSDLLRPTWAPHTYGHIQRALYRRADCVIVSSPALAANSALARCARRLVVIPYGVDVDAYQRPESIDADRVRAIRAGRQSPLVLFVGRLVYYKGVEVLCEAMARCPGTLVIVGTGPLEHTLRDMVDRLGLAERVIFMGEVADDDLIACYRAADLLVLPSVARTEAFGIVQIEAMAAGVPVISTNLPTGVPWVNQDGVSGLVVPPGDPHALAAAIQRIGGDVDLRRRLGEGARLRAATTFSLERMVASFKDVIETVVRNPDQLDRWLTPVGTL